jgi:putative transposase
LAYQILRILRLRIWKEIKMEQFRKKKWNKTARIAGWDYGSNATYCVRIGTKDGHPYFSSDTETQNFASPCQEEPSKKIMVPNEMGIAAIQYWNEIPDHFPFVKLGKMLLTPNNLYGIIEIKKPGFKKWKPNSFGPQTRNLASVIRGYKAAVKKYSSLHFIEFSWESRYDEKLILDEGELHKFDEFFSQNNSP